ncbi:hypothetical protein HN954_05105 [bacterium]|jgi:hypothetical protein|nr:hypothetical protein [bacterium]MBT6832327.1 hypothetical protein [bacterium]MBT6996772.1 hypothetical protein [bacterium]MBT7772815.1 hypothetical protein [bacterium]
MKTKIFYLLIISLGLFSACGGYSDEEMQSAKKESYAAGKKKGTEDERAITQKTFELQKTAIEKEAIQEYIKTQAEDTFRPIKEGLSDLGLSAAEVSGFRSLTRTIPSPKQGWSDLKLPDFFKETFPVEKILKLYAEFPSSVESIVSMLSVREKNALIIWLTKYEHLANKEISPSRWKEFEAAEKAKIKLRIETAHGDDTPGATSIADQLGCLEFEARAFLFQRAYPNATKKFKKAKELAKENG